MLLPGLIASVVKSRPIGEGIEAWCYYNNPWEAWGYRVQTDAGDGPRTGFGTLVWSDVAVLVVAVFYFAAALALAAALVISVWL